VQQQRFALPKPYTRLSPAGSTPLPQIQHSIAARPLIFQSDPNEALFAAGFDARHNSKAYAHLAAAVFASAGVKVRSHVRL
jgi:hypothetical protein